MDPPADDDYVSSALDDFILDDGHQQQQVVVNSFDVFSDVDMDQGDVSQDADPVVSVVIWSCAFY